MIQHKTCYILHPLIFIHVWDCVFITKSFNSGFGNGHVLDMLLIISTLQKVIINLRSYNSITKYTILYKNDTYLIV